MRKFLIGAAALLLNISIGYGQDLSFGVKAGGTYSYYSAGGTSADGFGFHVGGIFNAGFSNAFNLRVELLVSNRAIQNDYETTLFGVTTSYESHSMPFYLALPILYNYKVNDKLSFYAGAQFSFLLSNSVRSRSYVNGNVVTDIKVSGKDAMTFKRKFELGMAVCTEYNFSDNVGLGLRYIRGLQSLTDSETADDFYNGIQVSIVVKL